MATQNAQAATQDIQSLFDPQNYQNVLKTWAGMNERLTSLLVEAGTRSTDITAETAKESLSNLREATQVRDEPAEYGQAYSQFLQRQANLLMRTAQAYADLGQQVGSEASELAAKAGEEMGDKIAANTDRAANRAGSAAKKAS